MTQDQRLEAALARLTAALASLEAAAGRACRPCPPQEPAGPDLDGALDRAVAKAERLAAASEEVSRVLQVAIEALAAIVSRHGGSTED